MAELIDEAWRTPYLHIPGGRKLHTHSFVLTSLAGMYYFSLLFFIYHCSTLGMLFLGSTGMGAAVSHAPKDDKGKQRFVFYVMPHVGIDENGDIGSVCLLHNLIIITFAIVVIVVIAIIAVASHSLRIVIVTISL